MMQKTLTIILQILLCVLYGAAAQTVTIYRGGTALSPSYSTVTAAVAASINGDSLVLSGHTFYEHDIKLKHNIKMTGIPNGTTIDAQKLGRCLQIPGGSKCWLKNIIFQNGYSNLDGGAIKSEAAILELSGSCVVRWSYAKGFKMGKNFYVGGGGISGGELVLRDKVLITENKTGGDGGGFYSGKTYAFDSVIVSYNEAGRHGGGGIDLRSSTPGVSIIYNTAKEFGGGIMCYDSCSALIAYNVAGKLGGGVYGDPKLIGARILGNKAPKGAAFAADSNVTAASLFRCYVYNPDSSGKRQSELHATHNSGLTSLYCWFGEGDTTGLFTKGSISWLDIPIWVVPNWRLNRGSTPGINDTLFPVQAALRYNTGALLLAGSMPWLEGHFSSSLGTMSPALAPINAKDTIESMFRSFIAPPVSQPVDFLAYIDADTFRVRSIVWGKDTSKVLKDTTKDTTASMARLQVPRAAVQVYPVPATELLQVSGLVSGTLCQLYDMSGRMVRELRASGADVSIPLQDLAAGSYVLRVRNPEGWVASTQVQKE